MQNLHEPAIKELEAKLEEILAQAEGFKSSIQALKNLSTNGAIVSKVDNNKNIVSSTGILAIVEQSLKKLNKFAKIHQIATTANLEAAKVRGAITTLLNDKVVTKVQVTTSNGDTFWGLSDWKDSSGAVKKEHIYDESELLGRKVII